MLITLPLKQFLQFEQCPPDWRTCNLYLFRDGDVVFYAGQSYVAFDRVWTHIRDGYRARSVIGRFLLANWPASMRFTVELRCVDAAEFASVKHDLNAAERQLIERLTPCFNAALNRQPSPLPAHYLPPSAPLRCSRSIKHLIREANLAVLADMRRGYRDEMGAFPAWDHANLPGISQQVSQDLQTVSGAPGTFLPPICTTPDESEP